MKIQEAKYFSIIADEARDLPTTNYYRSVLGTLDCEKPQDKCLGFHECFSGVTGEVIANDMLTQLADSELCR